MSYRDVELLMNGEVPRYRDLREQIGAEITYRPFGCGQCGDWFESEAILCEHDCPFPSFGGDDVSFSSMIRENLSPTKEKLCDMMLSERLSRLASTIATPHGMQEKQRRIDTSSTATATVATEAKDAKDADRGDWWMCVLFCALYCIVLGAVSEYFKLTEMMACLVKKWLHSSRV